MRTCRDTTVAKQFSWVITAPYWRGEQFMCERLADCAGGDACAAYRRHSWQSCAMVITPLIEYVALFHLVTVNIIFNLNYQASSLSLLLLAATGSSRHIHRLFVPVSLSYIIISILQFPPQFHLTKAPPKYRSLFHQITLICFPLAVRAWWILLWLWPGLTLSPPPPQYSHSPFLRHRRHENAAKPFL